MSTNPAVVVIGLDAANVNLLVRWAREGSLPRIAGLLARGRMARSRGLAGFMVGSTWPSMYTGLSPARHGLHYLRQIRVGTYEFHRMAEHGLVRQPPFWEAVGRAGHRVAILDVPLCRLDPGVSGLQVIEWGSHDAVYGFRAAPAAVESRIVDGYGPHPGETPCDGDRRTPAEYMRFVEALERGARLKGKLTADLIRLERWGLAMQVFTEAHCAGHQCWHLHDPAHPNHDAAMRAATGDPLLRVYAAIDSAIGEILDAAGDATIVLLAAHGMSFRFGASMLLPEILAGLGATECPPPPPAEPMLHRLARAAWRELPETAQRALGPLRRALRSSPGPDTTSSLPSYLRRSRCFPVGNGLATAGIRLNLRGREPGGILAPGAEAEAFSEWLAAALCEIVDDTTGGPIVRRVLRTADLYQGECLDALPDLLVDWNDEMPLGRAAAGTMLGRMRVRSPRLGVVEGVNTYGRTGEHREEGFFLVAGPGIVAGEREEMMSLLDFAPTIAAQLGVTLRDIDGSVLSDLVAIRRSTRSPAGA